MRAAAADVRLAAPSLLSRTQATGPIGWDSLYVTQVAQDTAPDGSLRIVWSVPIESAGNPSGWYQDQLAATTPGMTVTMMGTVLGPSTARARFQIEYYDTVGAMVTAAVVLDDRYLDPVTPTAVSMTRPTPPEAVGLRACYYLLDTQPGASFTLWRMGLFVGATASEFWRLPEQ